MKLSRFQIILSLFLISSSIFAQQQSIEISGTVLEISSNVPIEFATVMIADSKTKTPITGGTTDLEGKFLVEANTSEFFVVVSFLGYVSKTIKDISIENGKVDLGTILLSEDKEVLEEVVVRAEKSTTEFKLDKRVFNVGKDLSSTGAGALEVLNNVCLLYTSPSPRDATLSRMPSSA